METPGEIFDKISILEIRAEKHPDQGVVRELRDEIADLDSQFDALLDRARTGREDLEWLARKRHKLRQTKAGIFKGSLQSLTDQLSGVNRRMWDNEDIRDTLMSRDQPSMGLLLADRREQQLNQDRNALIDAINDAVVKMVEAPCVLA